MIYLGGDDGRNIQEAEHHAVAIDRGAADGGEVIRIGGMATLHRDISLIMPPKQDRNAKISSESPMFSFKRDISVVKALAAVSGRQCKFKAPIISNPLPLYRDPLC